MNFAWVGADISGRMGQEATLSTINRQGDAHRLQGRAAEVAGAGTEGAPATVHRAIKRRGGGGGGGRMFKGALDWRQGKLGASAASSRGSGPGHRAFFSSLAHTSSPPAKALKYLQQQHRRQQGPSQQGPTPPSRRRPLTALPRRAAPARPCSSAARTGPRSTQARRPAPAPRAPPPRRRSPAPPGCSPAKPHTQPRQNLSKERRWRRWVRAPLGRHPSPLSQRAPPPPHPTPPWSCRGCRRA